MARKPTGRPVGRQPIYQDDSERPQTVSLRIPADLHRQAKTYASVHRQSITDLLLDGLRWRISEGDPRGSSGTSPLHEGNAYYCNTTTLPDGEGESGAATVLHEIREHLHVLTQAIEHHPLAEAQGSNTVIQQRAPQASAPEQAPVPTATHAYGVLTDMVWEAAQRLRRFTPAELAHAIGAKPKAVHDVLTRRLKKNDGTLRRDGRHFIVGT
jgi:hypothetical protein